MAKYCEEMVQKIEKAIKSGLSLRKTCELVDIAQQTFFDWMDKKPEFSERIKRARFEKITKLLEHIKAAGIGKKEITIIVTCPKCQHNFTETREIEISTKQWQALSWILERTEFDEFGLKMKHEHEAKEPIEIVVKYEN